MPNKPIPTGRNDPDDDFVVGYMCLVDFKWEIGMAEGGNTVFPSIENCRDVRKCTDQCGIVEVEVRARKIVQEPKELTEDDRR